MSNLGKVSRKWRSDLRHEIHATRSMNWAAGGTPVSSTTTFNCLFCRVDENSGDESWDIEGFWST